MSQTVGAEPAPPPGDTRDGPYGEPRLPLVITLIVAALIPLLMPDPLLPGATLDLHRADPGAARGHAGHGRRIDRRSRELRGLQIGILVILAAGTTFATFALTEVLVVGSAAITNSPTELMKAGGLDWIALLITFAFLYWQLDLGGPGERAHSARCYPDLAFPQDLNVSVARPDWRPTFVDYLYLGLTNNLAFSPTDVMPLAHWAKIAMGLQSIASLLVIGLVLARAVNIFA